jgi:hypothetical protein
MRGNRVKGEVADRHHCESTLGEQSKSNEDREARQTWCRMFRGEGKPRSADIGRCILRNVVTGNRARTGAGMPRCGDAMHPEQGKKAHRDQDNTSTHIGIFPWLAECANAPWWS